MPREWPKLDFKPWLIEWLDSRPTKGWTAPPDIRALASLTFGILGEKKRLGNHELPADLREKIEQELADLEAKRDSTTGRLEVDFQLQKAGERQSFLAQFISHKREEASALWSEYQGRLSRIPAVDYRHSGIEAIAVMLCDRLLKAQRDGNRRECQMLEEQIAQHNRDTLPVYEFLKERSRQSQEIQDWLEDEVARLKSEDP